jgi:hypothetical protein
MDAIRNVLRYLAGTVILGLTYHAGPLHMVGRYDSDYAGDVGSRKSTSGWVYLVNGTAVSWSSKLQDIVMLSTQEAEYYSALAAAKVSLWLKNITRSFL